MKPFSACVVLALLSCCQCDSGSSDLSKWKEFKAKHSKQHTGEEDAVRMKTFLEREEEIAEHNEKFARGEVSYSRGHNAYSDMTPEEHGWAAFGLILDNDTIPMAPSIKRGALPTYFDWRSEHGRNYVTSVKSQKKCGSCYAFAATAVIESYQLIKGFPEMNISEQDAVDCSYVKYKINTSSGPGLSNKGCRGGTPKQTLDHYVTNGLVEENSYPYTSGSSETHGVCNRPKPKIMFSGVKAHRVMPTSENHMAQLLITYGPLFVSIAAGDRKLKQEGFMDLKGGIFKAVTTTWKINHAVTLVGFGTENGVPYWTIKNSWGTSWGTGGFGRIRRGTNTCKILDAGVAYIGRQ